MLLLKALTAPNTRTQALGEKSLDKFQSSSTFTAFTSYKALFGARKL